MLANVVTSSDFDTKPWQLQGLEDVGSSFDDFVSFNQNEILLKLLGQTLYDAFSAGVAALPSVWDNSSEYVIGNLVTYGNNIYKALTDNQGVVPGTDPAQWEQEAGNRWLKLFAGDSYNINNRKYSYAGIKAFITPYIYSMWLNKESTSVVTTGGVVSANSENSSNMTASYKVMQAYLAFKKLVMNGYTTLQVFFYYASRCFPNQGTLFGYLYANDAVYFGDVSDEGDSNLVGYLCAHFEKLGSINDFDF